MLVLILLASGRTGRALHASAADQLRAGADVRRPAAGAEHAGMPPARAAPAPASPTRCWLTSCELAPTGAG